MFTALDRSISGHVQLLCFRLHQIHLRPGLAGNLYVHLVRAGQVGHLICRVASRARHQAYSAASCSTTLRDFNSGGNTSQV
jgi:hypothetical protein